MVTYRKSVLQNFYGSSNNTFILFSEKAFLEFFFKRLRLNETDRYPEFPYLSPCGRERNYVRCDDKAIVYTHIIEGDESDLLSYGGAADKLTVVFEPSKICMLPETGRIYHPASPDIGGVGLIKSSVAIAISKYFEFENGEENPPTKFTWKDKTYQLTNELLPLLKLTPVEARDFLYS